jgi:hypothetical protein
MGVSTHLYGPGFSRVEANVIGGRLRDEGQHAAGNTGDALGREVTDKQYPPAVEWIICLDVIEFLRRCMRVTPNGDTSFRRECMWRHEVYML